MVATAACRYDASICQLVRCDPIVLSPRWRSIECSGCSPGSPRPPNSPSMPTDQVSPPGTSAPGPLHHHCARAWSPVSGTSGRANSGVVRAESRVFGQNPPDPDRSRERRQSVPEYLGGLERDADGDYFSPPHLTHRRCAA